MKTAGIVAEYNPFHLGHAWQIRETRRILGEKSGIVSVMSGHWTQGADCAIADKWTRTEMALAGGVDLVLELPTLWAVSSAESFARGAVYLLENTGVVDALSFGSEAGGLEDLKRTADCLDSQAYRELLQREMGNGVSFAAARQKAVQSIVGNSAGCLSAPNNNLGVEYLRALARYSSTMEPLTIPRKGAGYHDLRSSDGFASATQIRKLMRNGDSASHWLEDGACDILNRSQMSDLLRCERAVLARIRSMEASDWAKLPDSGAAEGLPERLVRAAGEAVSLEEFYELAKTKRYTHARLRRLSLWAFLGLGASDRPEHPPYIRVLGMNQTGRELLHEMKKKARLPILTRTASIKKMEEPVRRVLELESRCTDLYALCLNRPWPCGREYISSPVIAD